MLLADDLDVVHHPRLKELVEEKGVAAASLVPLDVLDGGQDVPRPGRVIP